MPASPVDMQQEEDEHYMRLAYSMAKKSYDEGGIPIGSVLLVHGDDNKQPIVLGKGHNERVQRSSAILHAEIAALDNAGRLKAEVYRTTTLYTTLSPCTMCSGAAILNRIPRVVIGENKNFRGDEGLLRSRGIEVVVLDDAECKELMRKFIQEKPEVWYEDIGEIPP